MKTPEELKAYKLAWSRSEKGKSTILAWRKSERGIKIKKATRKKYIATPEAKKIKSKWGDRAMESWVGIIPKYTSCELCKIPIIYNSKNRSGSIHFDHRKGGIESIKGCPSVWLRGNWSNEKNIKRWKLCGFGMLCRECNKKLPTLNRIEWLNKALEYTKKEY